MHIYTYTHTSQGKAEGVLALAASRKAADAIFAMKNARVKPEEIDLHGLHVEEALVKTEERLARDLASGRGGVLVVIYGAGNHSLGNKQLLKPAVEKLLRDKGVQFTLDTPNHGCCSVVLPGGAAPVVVAVADPETVVIHTTPELQAPAKNRGKAAPTATTTTTTTTTTTATTAAAGAATGAATAAGPSGVDKARLWLHEEFSPEYSAKLCDCFSAPLVCAQACLCSCVVTGTLRALLDGRATTFVDYLGCESAYSVRRTMRKRFSIGPVESHRLEDCVAAFCCGPCVVTQEYNEYKLKTGATPQLMI